MSAIVAILVLFFAPLAQPVAQRPFKPMVEGSKPSGSTHRRDHLPGPPAEVVGEIVMGRLYQSILARERLDAWYAGVQAGEAALAAQKATESVSQPAWQPAPATSGGCYTDTPVPAWIINRESGGDPNAVNPSSGALGCYQELPDHFAPGAVCAGLSTDLAGQKACAWRLYNAAGLQPWGG